MNIKEFKISVDNESSAELEVYLSQTFLKMELFRSMNSSLSMGVLTFVDAQIDRIVSMGLNTSSNITFRWGYNENLSSNWNTYSILGIDAENSGSVTHVYITICDQSIHLRSNSSFRSFDPCSKSQLIHQVIEPYLELPNNSIIQPIVRETNDLFSYLQCGETDWDMLLKYTTGSMSTDNSIGDYRLYWKNGHELHFHPPDYEQQPYINIPIGGYSDNQQYKLRISPFKRSLKGGQLTKVSGNIRDTQKHVTFDSTFDTSIQGKPMIVSQEIKDGAYNVSPNNIFHGIYHYSEMDQEILIEHLSNEKLFQAYSDTYELEIYTFDNPRIEPGLLINVVPHATQTILDGIWLVESVFHNISMGDDCYSTIKLSRPFMAKGNLTMNVLENPYNKKPGDKMGPSANEGAQSSITSSGVVTKTAQQL